jgi:hypothetical protein
MAPGLVADGVEVAQFVECSPTTRWSETVTDRADSASVREQSFILASLSREAVLLLLYVLSCDRSRRRC